MAHSTVQGRSRVGRFAPSPTGPLHLGSLLAAVGSWLDARAAGGRWLLRIEDIDPPRERPGATAAILETLPAFDLGWDGEVEFQSHRIEHHRRALERLKAAGMAYPCWCSRSLLGPGGHHGSLCQAPPDPSRPPSWRVRVTERPIRIRDRALGSFEQCLSKDCGDFVVWRADDWPAYQLAVVVDDADQGVSDVVRGADLLESTPRQWWLQTLLGLPHPRWLHLPLVLDSEGRKLSKQEGALPVRGDDPMPALAEVLTRLQLPCEGDTPAAALTAALPRWRQRFPA